MTAATLIEKLEAAKSKGYLDEREYPSLAFRQRIRNEALEECAAIVRQHQAEQPKASAEVVERVAVAIKQAMKNGKDSAGFSCDHSIYFADSWFTKAAIAALQAAPVAEQSQEIVKLIAECRDTLHAAKKYIAPSGFSGEYAMRQVIDQIERCEIAITVLQPATDSGQPPLPANSGSTFFRMGQALFDAANAPQSTPASEAFRKVEEALLRIVTAKTPDGDPMKFATTSDMRDYASQALAALPALTPAPVSLEAGAKRIEHILDLAYAHPPTDFNSTELSKACAEAWRLPYVD